MNARLANADALLEAIRDVNIARTGGRHHDSAMFMAVFPGLPRRANLLRIQQT
jgi:hypothetical protein